MKELAMNRKILDMLLHFTLLSFCAINDHKNFLHLQRKTQNTFHLSQAIVLLFLNSLLALRAKQFKVSAFATCNLYTQKLFKKTVEIQLIIVTRLIRAFFQFRMKYKRIEILFRRLWNKLLHAFLTIQLSLVTFIFLPTRKHVSTLINTIQSAHNNQNQK